MNKHPLNHEEISPEEQLGNVYDSLADDVFDDAIEINQETIDRASRIAQAAVTDAQSSREPSLPEPKPPRP